MLATLLIAPYAFSKPPEIADALLVGDSLAGQLGPRLAKEATARGKKFLYNFRAGSSTRQWARGKLLERVLRQHLTRVVLISLGTNCTRVERPKLHTDVRNVLAQANIEKRSGKMVKIITTPVLWLLPPPLKFDTEYIRKAVAGRYVDHGRCRRLLVAGEELPRPFFPGKLPLESDGIHPTDAGHKQWAALLAKELWG